MSESMARCEHCMKYFPADKVDSHSSYCRRNFRRCSQCQQFIDMNFQKDHIRQFHEMQPCQFCLRKLPKLEVQFHQKHCLSQPKKCDYCQTQVKKSQYDAHIAACGSRTKQCQQCQQNVVLREEAYHISVCRGKAQPPPMNSMSMSSTMRNPFQPPSSIYPQQSSTLPYYPPAPTNVSHLPTVNSKIIQPDPRMVRPVQPNKVFASTVLQPASKIQANQLIANPPTNVAVSYGAPDEDQDLQSAIYQSLINPMQSHSQPVYNSQFRGNNSTFQNIVSPHYLDHPRHRSQQEDLLNQSFYGDLELQQQLEASLKKNSHIKK